MWRRRASAMVAIALAAVLQLVAWSSLIFTPYGLLGRLAMGIETVAVAKWIVMLGRAPRIEAPSRDDRAIRQDSGYR